MASATEARYEARFFRCLSRGWRAVVSAVAAAAIVASIGCGPPASTATQGEDRALLQEVVSRQERRVADARAQIAKLERELRLVQMRRRMLERDGRHDLALNLEMEEHALHSQLNHARHATADEEDALLVYRRQSGHLPPRP